MGYRNNKSSRSEQIVEEEKKDEKSETDHESASLHFSPEHLDKTKRSSDERGNTEPEQDNNQDGDHLLAPTLPTAAFQMQQHLQASLAHQQFLEQAAAVAAVQQHLTPTLNSLQLNNGISNDHHLQPQPPHLGMATTAMAAAVLPTNIHHQLFASQPLAASVSNTTVGNPQQALSAMGIGINQPISMALVGAGTAATAAASNSMMTNTNTTPSSLLPPVTIHSISTAASTTPAVLQQQQQQQLITIPIATVAAAQQKQQALIPQLTIPHYIPPQPPSWGAQFPALSVQDRPLVPPIYNGINPNYPGAQLLHAHPPIFCVHNFLSSAECEFLIRNATDAFGPAPVVGRGSGEVSPSRTSSTCYLAREDLPEYMRKITLLTGKPPEHCELPQVGRYYPSQQYLQHFDAFDLSNEDGIRFASNGGQRTITVLTYLNDVPRGGSTSFPNLNIQVRPQKGMALVFFPATLDGLLDKMALHAALPAVDVKYVSQVWVRQTNYDGTPSKRLVEPMVGGLQERWEEQQAQQQHQLLLGQLHMQAQQQQLGHHLQLQQHLQQQQQHLQQSNEQQQQQHDVKIDVEL
eukprot:scaffold13138_cov151-Skeletonema_marinoi.AAC.3